MSTALTLDLYRPTATGRVDGPGFVLTTTAEQREAWSGRLASLPPLSEKSRRDFVADYRRIMDEFDDANASAESDAHWYSAIGSRNTQNSSFYLALEQLWRLDRHLSRLAANGAPLGLMLPERSLLQPVQHLAHRHGVGTRVRGRFPARRWLDTLRRPWGAIRYLLILCDYGRAYGDFGPAGNDVLLVTVSTDDLLRPERSVRDFIFGELPADLARAGRKVLVVAQLTGQIQPAAGRARTLPPPPIRTLVDLARPRDVFFAVLQSAAWRPAVDRVRSALGVDVTSLLMQDIRTCRWRDLPAAFLLRKVLAQLLDRNPQAVLAHPFENNGWEHACHSAAQEKRSLTIAFQHNAPDLSSEKIYASRSRPHPNRIIAMGPAAKDMLVDRFGYRAAEIAVGYAMRQSSIFRHVQKTSAPQTARRILVLLQGTAEAVALVNLLADIFASPGGYLVTLRSHPAIPLAGQLRQTTLGELRPPFRASSNDDLHTDILDHDVAVSAGSTAGWEAVALGVPTIQVDLGSATPNNPLFEVSALYRLARNAEELVGALQAIAQLSDSQFKAEAARARRYFEEFFSTKTDDAFKRVASVLQLDPGT